MFFRQIASGLIFALCSFGMAHACEETVTLDRAQTIDLLNEVRSPDTDPLLQLFAFETLACSDQPGVRDLVLRTAANSPNATIRSQVLLRALFEQEAIVVHLLEVEGLSKVQYDRIKANPTLTLSPVYRDLSRGCMSFHRDYECSESSIADVQGEQLSIRVRWNGFDMDGYFRMQEGALLGTLSFPKDNLSYPARIDLF